MSADGGGVGMVEAEVMAPEPKGIGLHDGLALAERALNPARLLNGLRGAGFEQHAEAFGQAQELGKLAWVGMSVAAGSAHEQATHGDGLVKELADRFGLHPSRIQRLVRVYRELLKPMIEQNGDAIVLRLQEQTWYEYAVEFAPATGKTPAELLAIAEDRKAQEPHYGVREFASDCKAGDVSDDGSTLSQGKKLLNYCRKLADIDDASLDDAIQGADLKKHAGNVADAFSVLERLNAGLMARGKRP